MSIIYELQGSEFHSSNLMYTDEIGLCTAMAFDVCWFWSTYNITTCIKYKHVHVSPVPTSYFRTQFLHCYNIEML